MFRKTYCKYVYPTYFTFLGSCSALPLARLFENLYNVQYIDKKLVIFDNNSSTRSVRKISFKGN